MAKRYLRTWFPVDLVATVPWHLIATAVRACAACVDARVPPTLSRADGRPHILPIPRALIFPPLSRAQVGGAPALPILRLVRVVRLMKIKVVIAHISGRLLSNAKFMSMFSILRLLSYFLLLAHWGGCAWFVIAGGPDDNGWNRANNVYSMDRASQYVLCLLTSTDMLVDGRGAFPTNNTERIFTIGMSIVGACMVAAVFGTVAVVRRAARGSEATARSLTASPPAPSSSRTST